MIPVAAALPTTRKLVLPAPRVFALQVLSSHDVGRPVYGQLQKLLNVKDEVCIAMTIGFGVNMGRREL